MKTDQCDRGEALLIEAGALLRLSSDARSHEKAFALAQQAVTAGAMGGHAVLARMYEFGLERAAICQRQRNTMRWPPSTATLRRIEPGAG